MKVVIVRATPNTGEKDYEHLSSVVEFLLSGGNISVNPYLWGCDRTGYFCHLRDAIDFDGLRNNFVFPESIRLDEENNFIDCQKTYSMIRGLFR